MPAPGDQHNGRAIANPFEEIKPRISEYTAQEIATLQSRLEKQLGPEYISSRAGPSGQKVHYITADKCIQLANEVFGFNGWSSQIIETQVDFVDENAATFKVSLGLSVIVRVTLKDGTFHEDVGYGHIENCKGKAAAFEKAKKEGTTDGLKRALRSFGNVLGNCIYDKEYLSKVTKIKAPPVKWDVDNLHRHSTFTPQTAAKKEIEAPKMTEKAQAPGPASTSLSGDDTLIGEDEFGDFDDADFNVDDSTSHPDEVALPAPRTASHHFNNSRNNVNAPSTNAGAPNQSRPSGAPVPPVNRGPLVQPNRPVEAGGQNITRNSHPPGPPKTPNAGLARSISAAGPNTRAPQDLVQPNRPVNLVTTVPGRVLNQPNRPQLQPQPQPASGPPSPSRNDITDEMTPPGAGFFSARAAALLPQDHPPTEPPPVNLNLPAFNPNLESPSIRRTPGVDQKSSKPLSRDLKPIPASQSQAPTTGPSQAQPASRPVVAGNRNMNMNLGNPQLDTTRRIGAPGSPSPMNMGNRNSYKPPTMMKRPMNDANANRAPLTDLQTNGVTDVSGGGGGDIKRQRLNGM